VELQKEGKYKMYEIAEMVGISDYKYFNKVYKKYVGYAPAKLFDNVKDFILTT
jgi:two-component system response regulator YesN